MLIEPSPFSYPGGCAGCSECPRGLEVGLIEEGGGGRQRPSQTPCRNAVAVHPPNQTAILVIVVSLLLCAAAVEGALRMRLDRRSGVGGRTVARRRRLAGLSTRPLPAPCRLTTRGRPQPSRHSPSVVRLGNCRPARREPAHSYPLCPCRRRPCRADSGSQVSRGRCGLARPRVLSRWKNATPCSRRSQASPRLE